MRSSRWRSGEDGASLVLALIFIMVVGMLTGVGLTKSASTSLSGVQVRDRTQIQYALDGGIDRALQVLKDDVAGGNPSLCTGNSGPDATPVDITSAKDPSGFTLDGHSVTYTCQTLAGSTDSSDPNKKSNFALVTTSSLSGALTTGNAVSQILHVNGSIYLNAPVSDSDVQKAVDFDHADVVGNRTNWSTCPSAAAPANLIKTDSTAYEGCTEENAAQATGNVTLPALSGMKLRTPGSKTTYVDASPNCRVFFPGRYTAISGSDLLSGKGTANYFVSGPYYFDSIGNWSIPNNTIVIGGQPSSGDTGTSYSAANTGCAAFAATPLTGDTADTAVAAVVASLASTKGLQLGTTFPHGIEWILGGSSQVSVSGQLALFTPQPPPGELPVSLAAVGNGTIGGTSSSAVTGANYASWQSSKEVTQAVTNQTANAILEIHGRVVAPTAPVALFASNPTTAVALAGVVARTIDLGASASAPNNLVIQVGSGSTQPGETPPFRTVRVVSHVAGSTATNTALAEISNFGSYKVSVFSWRTPFS